MQLYSSWQIVFAFKDKLKLWQRRVNKGVFDMFQILTETLKDSKPKQALPDLPCKQLLACSFARVQALFYKCYRPLNCKEMDPNPFIFKPGDSTLPVQQQEKLLDIANDGSPKYIFDTRTQPRFWIKVFLEYYDFARKAFKTLLPLPTSYLCESGFSVMTTTKTKLRNRLNVRDILRVSLSSVIPRWERLVVAKQA